MAKIRVEPMTHLQIFMNTKNYFLLQELAESFIQKLYLPFDYVTFRVMILDVDWKNKLFLFFTRETTQMNSIS